MKRIIINRTDNIGDVVLTLPMAGYLKEYFNNNVEIIFLGTTYTKPIIECCVYVDKIIEYNKLEKLSCKKRIRYIKSLKADAIIHVYPTFKTTLLAFLGGIKKRVGTSRRLYNIFFCNKLINLSRRKSNLHESQLNLMLLKNFLKNFKLLEKDQIYKYYGLTKIPELPSKFKNLIDNRKFNLIIHPKSRGSAKEWGLNNFAKLIKLLPPELFQVFITGTEKEAQEMEYFLKYGKSFAYDLTGKMNLKEFIAFINNCDGLLSNSTGPLHIASALGKYAIGIYAPIRPLFPKRWGPIGINSKVFVKNIECNKCYNNSHCECIESIDPVEVYNYLMNICLIKLNNN